MKREEKLQLASRGSKKERAKDKVNNSVIVNRFRRFTDWLYSLLINGFFGKLFTAYSAEEKRFFESAS